MTEETAQGKVNQKGTVSRRRFIHGAVAIASTALGAACGVGIKPIAPEPLNSPPPVPTTPVEITPVAHKEQISNYPLTVLAIKGELKETGFDEKTKDMLERIDHALSKDPAKLVVTPEYSFYNEYEEEDTLDLQKEGHEYTLGLNTSVKIREIIAELQAMSKKFRCSIMASTFKQRAEKGDGDGISNNTLLHIKDGKIVGIKKRSYIDFDKKKYIFPHEGDWTINTGENNTGKTLKILPVICGEIGLIAGWQDNNKLASFVTENGPYDSMKMFLTNL